jgi:hypothetical protein
VFTVTAGGLSDVTATDDDADKEVDGAADAAVDASAGAGTAASGVTTHTAIQKRTRFRSSVVTLVPSL